MCPAAREQSPREQGPQWRGRCVIGSFRSPCSDLTLCLRCAPRSTVIPERPNGDPTASLARELAHDFEREPALLVVTSNFDDGLIEAAGDIFVEPRTAILGRAGHCEGVCGLDGKQAHGRVE